MLFEVAPEATARRLAEALLAAEVGDVNAWRRLDDNALFRLRTDADVLATIVPFALFRLAEQLVAHPRASVRLDVTRLLWLVYHVNPHRAEAALRRLSGDLSRGVQHAAANVLMRFGHAV